MDFAHCLRNVFEEWTLYKLTTLCVEGCFSLPAAMATGSQLLSPPREDPASSVRHTAHFACILTLLFLFTPWLSILPLLELNSQWN